MTKKYAVNEIFYTLQGEGAHAGTPAVFVRLAGCNLWRNTSATREADSMRNGAQCPKWCDTAFDMKETLTAQEIADRVHRTFVEQGHDEHQLPLIVLTGGEPLLQLDLELFNALFYETSAMLIAVETNGTKGLHEDLVTHYHDEEIYITCSPKVAPSKLALRHINELKVVFPDYDPSEYEAHFRSVFRALEREDRYLEHFWDFDSTVRCFVQPRAVVEGTGGVGKSLISQDHTERAVQWVMKNPKWRLSMQTHKILGVP